MLGKFVRDPKATDSDADKPLLHEEFEDSAPKTADQVVFFDGNDPIELRCRAEELCIEGLHEPGVDDPDRYPFGLQEFSGGEGRINAGADRDYGKCRFRAHRKQSRLSL